MIEPINNSTALEIPEIPPWILKPFINNLPLSPSENRKIPLNFY